MKEQVYEQLTLFPEDSPASHSPLPGSEQARTMTVISGLKCLESYGNSGPLGSLVRMCLGSSIWHSTRCFLTWKTKATKLNRLLFRLAVSTPHISESGSLFWHRGGAQEPVTGERRQDESGPAGMADGLRATVHEADSDTNNDGLQGSMFKSVLGGDKYDMLLRSLLECTPLGKIGPMNPAYLEWLMGYPIGWTELNRSATQ